MSMNKVVLILLSLMLFASCIENYVPEEINSSDGTLVIYGSVTNLNSLQEIEIRRSSNVYLEDSKSVTNASVIIEHESGAEFTADHEKNGLYKCLVDPNLLKPGNAFRVRVYLNSEGEYCSDFSRMVDSAPMDTLKSKIEIHKGYGNEPDIPGVQFSTDFLGDHYEAEFYRWEILETWDYKVPYLREYYYNRGIKRISPNNDLQTCYKSTPVNNVFTLSLLQMQTKEFKDFPLHFVSNQSSRVNGKYRLRVRQYGVSRKDYFFWKSIEQNSKERGGLYDTQPFTVIGNICSVNDPDEKVLGNFEAVYGTQIEVEYNEGFDLGTFEKFECTPMELFWPAIFAMRSEWPIWLYPDYSGGDEGSPELMMASQNCFDCRKLGGTLQKPKNW